MLESIYVASNIASTLDFCKFILGTAREISKTKVIPNLGL